MELRYTLICTTVNSVPNNDDFFVMLNSKCQNAFLLVDALALSEETLDPIYTTMEKIEIAALLFYAGLAYRPH